MSYIYKSLTVASVSKYLSEIVLIRLDISSLVSMP